MYINKGIAVPIKNRIHIDYIKNELPVSSWRVDTKRSANE